MNHLILPFPPSVNAYWRAPNKGALKGRVLISKKGRDFKSDVLLALIKQVGGLPKTITQDIEVSVVLYPPNRQCRDIDNYCKALFDALTRAGLWKDDSQIKRTVVEWGQIVRGGRTIITLAPYNRDPVTFPGDEHEPC